MKVDVFKAKILYRLALLSLCLNLLGCFPTLESNFQQLLSLAEQGNGGAQDAVAVYYRDGYGVKRDNKKSCEWFKKASETTKLASAQFSLSKCYETDDGLGINPEQAKRWLLISANNNSGPIGPTAALRQIRKNLGVEYQDIDSKQLTALVKNEIVTKSDLDATIIQMKSDPYYVKNFNSYGADGVLLWVEANDDARLKGVSSAEVLGLIKKQRDAQEKVKLAKEAEARKQIEQARQQELRAKVEKEKAIAQEKVKAYEQEKNSWYSYKKILNIYVCNPPSSGDSNPGTMLSYVRNNEDSRAYTENEFKEDGRIISVDIVLPNQNAILRYVRGKQRCEITIKQLNAQIKNEDEALKNKYK